MKALALLLLVCAAPLASQTTSAASRGRLEGRVPAASLPAIDSLIGVAAAEHLPTDLLIQKAVEGGAKHVSGDRIVKAIALNLDQLREAQALLVRAGDAPPVTPAEVASVLSARKRGLGVPVVERIVRLIPEDRRASALHAVADLAAHHFDADSATDLIVEAARQGLHGGRLLDVAYAAIQETQRGHTHAEALATIQHELPDVPAVPPPARGAVQRARRPLAANGGDPQSP